MAYPMMIQAQESQTESESVVVEGVGKTEASAKKAAYKEAVAKVVGVLIDSSTLVKNDKIINEELLEYSGGFVTKSEMISSMKDDEGLVRVKIKCTVEKAQVKKKLQEFKILEVKIDGDSIAAMEMSKEAMQKNASVLLNKAIKEREKIFTAILPSKFESLDKTKDGKYTIPVVLAYDQEKLKIWTENWLPVFEKMAINNGTTISNLQKTGPNSLGEFGLVEGNAREKPKFRLEGTQNMIIILPISVTLSSTKNRWFLIPCKKSDVIAVKWQGNTSYAADLCKLKLQLSIKSKSGDDIFVAESMRFGNMDSKEKTNRPLARSNPNISQVTGIAGCFSEGLIFPPLISKQYYYSGNTSYYLPERYGCIFEAEIANDDLPKIDKMTANISWVYP
jgi:hypothetical protein